MAAGGDLHGVGGGAGGVEEEAEIIAADDGNLTASLDRTERELIYFQFLL